MKTAQSKYQIGADIGAFPMMFYKIGHNLFIHAFLEMNKVNTIA